MTKLINTGCAFSKYSRRSFSRHLLRCYLTIWTVLTKARKAGYPFFMFLKNK